MTEREQPGIAAENRSIWAIRCRIGWLITHLIFGLFIVALGFPLLAHRRRNQLKARWAKQLLGIMGVELRLRHHGADDRAAPVEIPEGCLLVANHISWLDIFVISAACPTAFVAKAEIRKWPMLGWLAKEADTLFIERGSRHHAQHIAHQMAALLKSGFRVAVFPEGTTSDGRGLLPFHAALVQPAVSAGSPIQPLAIRYRDRNGNYSAAPAYYGEISLGESLHRTLSMRGLVAELTPLPALNSTDSDRRTLTKAAETAIRDAVKG